MSNTLEFPIVENYSPEITVELVGVGSNKKLIAILDTGFTGFLQIPLAEGIKAHLNLWGIRPFILADGRSVKSLECFGTVRFANKDLSGFISLSEGGDECLLGMQFLQQLKMNFTISTENKKAIFTEIDDVCKSEDKNIETQNIDGVCESKRTRTSDLFNVNEAL